MVMANPTFAMLRLTARYANKPLILRCTIKSTTSTTTPFQNKMITASISTSSVDLVDRKVRSGEEFWKKNDRMKRPMSPHIGIYKFPMPALMSITNRVTGGAWSVLIAGAGITALVYPGDSAAFLAAIKALEIPMPVMASLKFVVLFPFTYHTINGVRHLMWDYYNVKFMRLYLSEIHQSGWLVVALSVLVTGGAVGYCYM